MSPKASIAKVRSRSAKPRAKQPPQTQQPKLIVSPPPKLTRQPRAATHVPLVCSLTDPFCEHARQGRYPDANGVRSLSYPLRTMFTITTSAAGQSAYLLTPNYLNAWALPSSTGTFPNLTFGNAFVPRAVITAATNVRLVSWGFKINHISTPLSSSGVVMIRGLASQSGSTLLNIDVSTMNADVIANIPLQDCSEVAVVGKRANTNSQFYTSPSGILSSGAAGVTLYSGFGWDAYVISISGGPASAGALNVEIFENWEIVIDDSDASAQLMIKPPTANSVATKAAAVVTSTAETVFLRGVGMASAYLKRAAITALGGLFAGPGGARAAMLLD